MLSLNRIVRQVMSLYFPSSYQASDATLLELFTISLRSHLVIQCHPSLRPRSPSNRHVSAPRAPSHPPPPQIKILTSISSLWQSRSRCNRSARFAACTAVLKIIDDDGLNLEDDDRQAYHNDAKPYALDYTFAIDPLLLFDCVNGGDGFGRREVVEEVSEGFLGWWGDDGHCCDLLLAH